MPALNRNPLPKHGRKASLLDSWFGIQRIDDAIFMIAFFIWLFMTILAWSTFFAQALNGLPIQAVYYGSSAMLLVAEILSIRRGVRWTKRSAIGFAVLVVLGVCCYNGRLAMIWALPFIFCARNRDYLAICKVAIVAISAALVVTMLSAYSGIIPNPDFSAPGRPRQAFGFRYPLYPAMLTFSATCMALLISRRQLDVALVAMLLALNTIMFFLTGSRLSFILAIAAIVIAAVFQRLEGKRCAKPVAAIFASSFVLAAFVSIVLAWTYDPSIPWMQSLDMNLEGRLRLGHDGLLNFGITLFGQKVAMVGNALSANGTHSDKPYNFIDCVYLQYLIVLGVVYFIVFIAAMTVVTFRSFVRGYLLFGMLLILVAIHGMVDNLNMYLWANPLLFACSLLMAEPGRARWDGEPFFTV